MHFERRFSKILFCRREVFLNNTGEIFGALTPGQAPTGPSWLPSAPSQRAKKMSKSSQINSAWQIGATGLNEADQQDGGLSEIMLKGEDPCQGQKKKSRKRMAEDSGNDARMMLAWIDHTSSDSDQEESTIKKKFRTKYFKVQLRLSDEVCSETEYGQSLH